MMELAEAVKPLSPYKKNCVIWELLFPKMLGLIFLILFRSVDLSSEKLEHENRKWKVVSTTFLELQRGLRKSWELC